MNATLYSIFSILSLSGVLATNLVGQLAEPGVLVGNGWHPWYEVQADPENPTNLIICGTKWDATLNSALGFVYASSNGGSSWQPVFEDRNSAWVTEQSCAFGPNHRAYFISEASEVVDGELNHHLGKTRLYISSDGGQHWAEAARTGWADFSTSAVSAASHRLYTFFNATRDEARKITDVGLLVFAQDGKSVAGPFFDSMAGNDYQGIYPSNAIALKSGEVVALYYGLRPATAVRTVELGIIIADASDAPSMKHVTISRATLDGKCINAQQGALAYDSERSELLLVFVEGCKNSRIVLKSSRDEGRTWKDSGVIAGSSNPGQAMAPSLVACGGGVLGFAWEQGWRSGRWLFSYLPDHNILAPATLSAESRKPRVAKDSLWTSIEQAYDRDTPMEQAITVNVRSDPEGIWRANSLACLGDRVVAVWPAASGTNGSGLYSRVLRLKAHLANQEPLGTETEDDPDVTRQTLVLYGGGQQFDDAKNILRLCLTLENRGSKAIRAPIRVEAIDISSPLGSVSALESINGLPGPGAFWDISDSLTGNQIPPNATSNPFCLSFHFQIPAGDLVPPAGDDILTLKLRVLASPHPAKPGPNTIENRRK